jgi:hypothetical protein
MNKQQMEDREQFRRYAEAALSGQDAGKTLCGPSYAVLVERSFAIASAMMLAEQWHWEAYQLRSLEAVVDDERIKHEGK